MADHSGRAASDPLNGAKKEQYDEWFEASPDPWKALAGLAFGADRTVANAVETEVWTADEAQNAELETHLLDVLQKSLGRPAATLATCQLLAMVAGDASVPALAKLLQDPAHANVIRIALEPIPGPAADGALRDALPALTGDSLVGLIGSIAVRRDAAARPALEKIATDPRHAPAVRTAAKNALTALAE